MTKTIESRKREIQIGSKINYDIPTDNERGFPLLLVREEYFTFEDLIVDDQIKGQLKYLVSENKNSERLKAYGLIPKQKILFCGPPGTGKTMSAKILSNVMSCPLVYIMFDSMVSSFLGQTASNLRKIFDFIENDKFVVLFDEFDVVGKRRDDPQEHGEVKRVVNNLMQMIDNYDGDSILIAATNHPQLLDTAIWRRFDEIIEFGLPNTGQRRDLFEKYLDVLKKSESLDLNKFAAKTARYSAADISMICKDALRKSILSDNVAMQNSDILWSICEQKRRKKSMVRVS